MRGVFTPHLNCTLAYMCVCAHSCRQGTAGGEERDPVRGLRIQTRRIDGRHLFLHVVRSTMCAHLAACHCEVRCTCSHATPHGVIPSKNLADMKPEICFDRPVYPDNGNCMTVAQARAGASHGGNSTSAPQSPTKIPPLPMLIEHQQSASHLMEARPRRQSAPHLANIEHLQSVRPSCEASRLSQAS